MKLLKIYAAVAALLLTFTAKAQFIKAEVQVSGLTCSMCQLATQKALKTLDFVNDIKPDLNTNIYVLTFRNDKAVNLDQIKKKVKGAGFSVSKLVVVFNFNNQKVEDNYDFKYSGNIYRFINAPQRTLNGNIRLNIIDKDFIPSTEAKKYTSQTISPYYKTGFMGKERVYHVTI